MFRGEAFYCFRIEMKFSITDFGYLLQIDIFVIHTSSFFRIEHNRNQNTCVWVNIIILDIKIRD